MYQALIHQEETHYPFKYIIEEGVIVYHDVTITLCRELANRQVGLSILPLGQNIIHIHSYIYVHIYIQIRIHISICVHISSPWSAVRLPSVLALASLLRPLVSCCWARYDIRLSSFTQLRSLIVL